MHELYKCIRAADGSQLYGDFLRSLPGPPSGKVTGSGEDATAASTLGGALDPRLLGKVGGALY